MWGRRSVSRGSARERPSPRRGALDVDTCRAQARTPFVCQLESGLVQEHQPVRLETSREVDRERPGEIGRSTSVRTTAPSAPLYVKTRAAQAAARER